MSGDTFLFNYNTAFTKNYDYLLKWSKYDVDILHDVYLKIIRGLYYKGFEYNGNFENKIMNYIKTTIVNTFKTSKTRIKFNNQIALNKQAEEFLIKLDDDNKDDLRTQAEYELIIEYLFKYLKKKYTQKEQYIFRSYYLSNKNMKRLTYKQLSKRTGYNIAKISLLMKKMKQDLKDHLIDYINYELTKKM